MRRPAARRFPFGPRRLPLPSSFRSLLFIVACVALLLLNFHFRSSPHSRRIRSLLLGSKTLNLQTSNPAPGHGAGHDGSVGKRGVGKWGGKSEREREAAVAGREGKDMAVVFVGLDGFNASSLQGTAAVRLSNGLLMPRLGFGTAGLGEETQQAVGWALAAGYRLLDSAQAREWYREDLVGAAVRTAGIPRKELFIVSKLHPRHMGFAITLQRFEDSLRDLGTSYVDLFLLHYPWCFPAICGKQQPKGLWSDSWRAMEEVYKRGKARAIGVSNFGREEMMELLRQAEVKPHVLQRNSDPLRQDQDLQQLCREQGIQYMGYSTLGSQWQFQGGDKNPVLTHPTIIEIGNLRGCTPAQVVIKWALMIGQVVIPRSSNEGRIKENLESPKCKLLEEDLSRITALDGSFEKTS